MCFTEKRILGNTRLPLYSVAHSEPVAVARSFLISQFQDEVVQ